MRKKLFSEYIYIQYLEWYVSTVGDGDLIRVGIIVAFKTYTMRRHDNAYSKCYLWQPVMYFTLKALEMIYLFPAFLFLFKGIHVCEKDTLYLNRAIIVVW